MQNVTILENLKLQSFKENENDEIKIEGAIFLTYSIESKTILSALISMFTEDADSSGETDPKAIIHRWEKLIQKGMGFNSPKGNADVYADMQEHIAFICNDGNDKSIDSPIYDYTKGFTYYFKLDKGSFHPKFFLIKYRRNDNLYFRFMIGSMNFVNSKNKEMIAILDEQAYEGDDNGKRGKCNILSELLNLENMNSSTNILNMRQSKLYAVIENIGLDKVYFDSESLSRILTFPSKDITLKENLKKAQIVVSPFLTKSYVDKVGENCALYTMESELKKHGYNVAEEDTKNAKKFYVYRAKEGEKAFSHIKLYVTDDAIYLGSLNFTQSAFEDNKELLIKLEKSEAFVQDLKSYLNNAENYEQKYFIYDCKRKENPSAKEKFKEMMQALSKVMCLSFDKGKCILRINENFAVNSYLKEIKESKEIENAQNIEITIAPFSCPNKEKCLNSEELKSGKEFIWEINNRVKRDNYFTFTMYEDKRKIAQVYYHIKIKELDLKEERADEKIVLNMMLYRLSELLANKGTTSKTITKENEQIERGNASKTTGAYLRKMWPTLESILQKNMEKERIDVLDMENRVCNIQQIKELLNCDMSEEEKQYLGFGQSNKKMLENLLRQGELLLQELREM